MPIQVDGSRTIINFAPLTPKKYQLTLKAMKYFRLDQIATADELLGGIMSWSEDFDLHGDPAQRYEKAEKIKKEMLSNSRHSKWIRMHNKPLKRYI